MRGALLTLSCVAFSTLSACSDAQEAKRVELQVVTDGVGLEPITTDLGYEVALSSATLTVDDLKFTIAGEAHVSLWRRLSDAVVPTAHAHPGHFQGGEVTGELPGHFVLRFLPDETREVGVATLLVGTYQGVNLGLAYASAGNVGEGDPVAGHTAALTGTASKDGSALDFQVLIDSPQGRELVGIPFAHEITESADAPLVLRLMTRDPLENDTLFDGIDFALLDGDADGRVEIEQTTPDAASAAACNTVRRILQTHDHFLVQPQR